jgi:hypothetical protein
MKTCITCGMPFVGDHANDIGLETAEGPVCKFDSENGKVKSGKEIFEGGVIFFEEAAAGGDRELAARLTRKNMNTLPYWKAHHFAELDGEEASEEEFAQALAKL